MNPFRRQQLRGIVVTLLTAALLAGAVGFLLVSLAAGEDARQQWEAIDSRYLTIGLVREQETPPMLRAGLYNDPSQHGDMWCAQNFDYQDDGSILWDDGSVYYSAATLESKAAGTPPLLRVCRSSILSAHVKGVYALTSASQNELHYNRSFDNYGSNFCVAAVCTAEADGRDPDFTRRRVTVRDGDHTEQLLVQPFTMIYQQPVSIHPYYKVRMDAVSEQYPIFRELEDGSMEQIGSYLTFDRTNLSLFYSDGSCLFSYGKNYLVRGFLQDLPIVQGTVRENGEASYVYQRYSRDLDHSEPYVYRNFSPYLTPTSNELYRMENLKKQICTGQENFILNIGEGAETFNVGTMTDASGNQTTMTRAFSYLFYEVPDNGWPYVSEFTGTVEEFLASEEGRVWREEIIPTAEINQQSATVILTDNLDYLHRFNVEEARIIDGREITPVEYDSGAPVCLISASYAEVNGLSVGDSLTLDYYDTGYFITTGGWETVTETTEELVIAHNPLQQANRIGFEQEYEIVGIYTAPEWEFGIQTFHADTIFVPKQSVPNAEAYENPSLPLLNAVVLRNGSEAEFEQHMQSLGFGGYYQYFSHDYSSTMAGLEALSVNAQRLQLIGVTVLVITAVLFYYLNYRRMIPVARTVRSLGGGRFVVWWQMQWTVVPLVVLSVFAGCAACMYFFTDLTDGLLKTVVLLDRQTVYRLTLAGALLLSLPSLLIAIPISLPNLMKRT